MTNIVLDAGTDVRVANFLKRGLEVIGLAVLDPVEAGITESWPLVLFHLLLSSQPREVLGTVLTTTISMH